MYTVSGHTSFFQSLLEIDRCLARITKETGCPDCGGILDVRNYPRKPRGIADIGDGHDLRFSFCCRNDGCRRGVTSPSVRFLGRKVYSALIVILSTMGVPWQASEFEVSRQTERRWQEYWRCTCDVGGMFYREKISLFAAGFRFEPPEIFTSFLERYRDLKPAWSWCLRFFSPLSTSLSGTS
jgi:hypothetical protein